MCIEVARILLNSVLCESDYLKYSMLCIWGFEFRTWSYWKKTISCSEFKEDRVQLTQKREP